MVGLYERIFKYMGNQSEKEGESAKQNKNMMYKYFSLANCCQQLVTNFSLDYRKKMKNKLR
jgi:hypothetical protein